MFLFNTNRMQIIGKMLVVFCTGLSGPHSHLLSLPTPQTCVDVPPKSPDLCGYPYPSPQTCVGIRTPVRRPVWVSVPQSPDLCKCPYARPVWVSLPVPRPVWMSLTYPPQNIRLITSNHLTSDLYNTTYVHVGT